MQAIFDFNSGNSPGASTTRVTGTDLPEFYTHIGFTGYCWVLCLQFSSVGLPSWSGE
jgi:hypothetical protein